MKAITIFSLAKKKQYSCWGLGFVGFKNGFNIRQINWNSEPFLELTKAMKYTTDLSVKLLKTIDVNVLLSNYNRKISYEISTVVDGSD